MSRKRRPKLDESIKRDEITMGEFTAAVKATLLQPVPERLKSENRKPTKEELERRWKLVRRESAKPAS